MPATFHPELKAAPRQDGTRAIRIRITKFRKHAYYNTGKYVLASQWNPKPSTKLHNYVLRHDDAPQYNNAIKSAISGLEQFADKLPAGTAADIKAAYENHLNPEADQSGSFRGFFSFGEEYATRLGERNYKTGDDLKYRLPEFKAIAGEKTPFEELLSPRMLHKYTEALKVKGNSPITIKNKMRDLRTIYNAGVREKQFPDIGKPFSNVKVTVPKKKRIRPTATQVIEFINYTPKNKLQQLAKNVGMLQYLLQGARIGEAITLEWENVQEKYVEYLPQKAAHKPKFVPRSELLNRLLQSMPTGGRYVLPYLKDDYPTLPPKRRSHRKKRVIKLTNLGLDEIAKELKFNFKMTSHMFRHAFADALIAAGANPHTAAALLGHANAKTSETYFKDLGLEDTSEMALSIFNKLEANTRETIGEQ